MPVLITELQTQHFLEEQQQHEPTRWTASRQQQQQESHRNKQQRQQKKHAAPVCMGSHQPKPTRFWTRLLRRLIPTDLPRDLHTLQAAAATHTPLYTHALAVFERCC